MWKINSFIQKQPILTYFKIFVIVLFPFFTKAQQINSGLLWEISGNGLEKPSYIFGTIHLICPDNFFLPAGTEDKFKTAQQVYLEIDMDDPQMMMKAQKLMLSVDGKKLKDLMKEADYKTFSEYFKKTIGMDVAMFGSAKPMLYMSVALMKTAGCAIPKSYEDYFAKQAKEIKLEIYGLEAIEEQMELMDKAPVEQQIAWLMDLVTEATKENDTYQQMLTLYKNQDIESLTKMIGEEMVGMKGLKEEMLVNRNKKWIPLIEKISLEKPTFFAVGAGHLGGEQGVLKFLQLKGYSVKRVEK
ncbi:hypothetical protein EMA8858_00754 [Emticicia aquatica]|uniref:TraB/GumN family protein n=1 Tax=Emticicia aquatica TaxID=1681835 RepID=A0ABM9ALJ5_9BACT|nr:TraB/GumN family protein [Emticicia aquatica]CAH0994642.1 hypothetical protein EMA8858_00754 [Emticicia aquatica]